MESPLTQANWYVNSPINHDSIRTNSARPRKESNLSDPDSSNQSSDSFASDSFASSFPTIPANKNSKRYSMRSVFQAWYDNEATLTAGKKTPQKTGEPYKVAKPAPIYHLELQHAMEEAEQHDEPLDAGVKTLSISESQRATAPPPNLPVPPKQQIPTADGPAKLIEPSKLLWLYLDPSGNEQGPFSGEVMQDWLTEGYLSFDLRIRRSTEPNFQTLNEFCGKVRNFTHPFLVPLPEIETDHHLSSASPNGAINSGTAFEALNLSHISSQLSENGNGNGSGLASNGGFQPNTATANGSLSAFNTPLYSQLLPNGGLGANNMRMPSSNHLFDFMGNNDYSLMNQQQFPPSNQFGIDPSIGQNIGQNIGTGFGQLNMLSLLHQQIQPTQPLMSRTNSGWGVDSNLTGNALSVNANPLGMSQPNPISPWLSGVQSISRVSSPFVPPTALTNETKAEDHVLQDLHKSMVTGILSDDDHAKQDFVTEPELSRAKEPEIVEAPKRAEVVSEAVEQVQLAPEPIEGVVIPKKEVVVEEHPAEPLQSAKVEKVTSEESTKPKLAPWAASASSGPSAQPELTLKQIQQLEAERMEKERQLRAEMRQEQAQAQALAEAQAALATTQKQDDKSPETVTFNWASAKVTQPAVAQKTLAEIQREEAEARAKVLKASAAAGTSISKPSLASSLATAVPKEDFSAWTTVASKKMAPKKASVQTTISSPSNASLSPQMLRAASSNSVIGNSVNNNALKEDFLVWARSAMTNLYPSVSKDDLLEIFTTLPVLGDSAQLISETIYSSSATMDGRRFAQEFLKRRQQVEKKLGPGDNGSWSAAISASADKVPAVDDDGWSTSVKSKKKGKKN